MREHKKSHLGIMGWAMFLAGAMSLGSCSSDETLESMEPKAITFGSVSMENHSRAAADPSYGQTTNLLDKFQVWGTVKGNTNTTVKIFNGAEITRGQAAYGAAWTQTTGSAQYWIPSATYKFMAIANATDVDFGTENAPSDLPTDIDFILTDGSKDLLLANGIKTVTTNASGIPSQNPVAFTMTHLLSKVHFTFDGSATNVAKIEVTGHYGSGTYTIGAATPWGNQDLAATTSPLSFGGIDANDKTATTSQYARLIIPGEQTWTINLYELKNEQYVQIGNTLTLDYTAANDNRNSGGFIFAPNTQYNINISLGVDMDLSVSVQDWEGVTIRNNFSDNVSVGTRIQWTGAGEEEIKFIEYDVDNSGNVVENVVNDATNADACYVKLNNLEGKKFATFNFNIAGPVGGTWHAILVPIQGNPNGFQLSKSQGDVGTPATITITGRNNSNMANMMELRFVVRVGGKILPVDDMTYWGDANTLKGELQNGDNYIIVQDPE